MRPCLSCQSWISDRSGAACALVHLLLHFIMRHLHSAAVLQEFAALLSQDMHSVLRPVTAHDAYAELGAVFTLRHLAVLYAAASQLVK